jgi:hypothetical protein
MSAYAYTTASTYQSHHIPFQSMHAPSAPAASRSYSYLPHNPSPAEVESYNRRVQEATAKRRLDRPTNSKRSQSTNGGSSSAFLDVQGTPVYNRRSAGHGRADSRSTAASSRAPSLTRSSSSEEEGAGVRPPSGPNTPYSAKVALWRDDIQDSDDGLLSTVWSSAPSSHSGLYDEFGYLGQRNYEPAGPSPPSNPFEHQHVSSGKRKKHHKSVNFSDSSVYPSSHQAPLVEVEATCSAIDDSVYQLNARVLAFTFPKVLDFEETPDEQDDGPRLAYTPRNKPLIEHTRYLDELLTQLDGIIPNGNPHIIAARKEAVKNVLEELKQLKRMKKMVRDNVSCRTRLLFQDSTNVNDLDSDVLRELEEDTAHTCHCSIRSVVYVVEPRIERAESVSNHFLVDFV